MSQEIPYYLREEAERLRDRDEASVEPQVEPSEEDLIADAFAKAAANRHGGTIQTKIVDWTPTHENCDECNKLAPKMAADSVSHLPTVSRDCRHCGHNIVYSLSAGGWVHMPDETKQCFLGEDSPDAEPSVSHPPLEQEPITFIHQPALVCPECHSYLYLQGGGDEDGALYWHGLGTCSRADKFYVVPKVAAFVRERSKRA